MNFDPVSRLTRYPNLFKNTYWGGFSKKKSPIITEEIIENRNKFVEENDIFRRFYLHFKVKDYFSYFERCKNFHFDHFEEYKTKDNEIIIIYSNYSGDKQICSFSKYLGFKPYRQLYNIKANTFIAFFDNIDSLKNKIKNFTSLKHDDNALKEVEITDFSGLVEYSSGNVFKDLGFPDKEANEFLRKADLRINKMLKKRSKKKEAVDKLLQEYKDANNDPGQLEALKDWGV
jgi:hypothetical protein